MPSGHEVCFRVSRLNPQRIGPCGWGQPVVKRAARPLPPGTCHPSRLCPLAPVSTRVPLTHALQASLSARACTTRCNPSTCCAMSPKPTTHPRTPTHQSTSASQNFISMKYEFIYIRQPKSGSTAIERAMHRLFCNSGPCSSEVLDHFRPVPGRRQEEIRWWRSFFVFTFVRNPCAPSLAPSLSRLRAASTRVVLCARALFFRAASTSRRWTRMSSAYFMFTEWTLKR